VHRRNLIEPLHPAVDRGQEPFFLGPGKHWQSDIPQLASEAAVAFPRTTHTVAAPLGFDELILQLLDKRVAESRRNAQNSPAHEAVVK
jgi:sirohydrochlorin ferrochelatase